ncbi:MAG: hypothetical protein E5X11_26755, partial [Mesorhizobium sp.]
MPCAAGRPFDVNVNHARGSARGLASEKCEPAEDRLSMSLPVLVVLVVFGIALSVAAVHFTGGT